MANLEDNSEKIAQIDEILASGIASTSTDGQSTNFRSVDELRKIRDDLERRDQAGARRKPRVSTIHLNRF